MNEYHDCIQRAHRLASVKENHLAGKSDSNVEFVTMEDLLIYLRWLVCHLHAMKHFNQYLRVRPLWIWEWVVGWERGEGW